MMLRRWIAARTCSDWVDRRPSHSAEQSWRGLLADTGRVGGSVTPLVRVPIGGGQKDALFCRERFEHAQGMDCVSSVALAYAVCLVELPDKRCAVKVGEFEGRGDVGQILGRISGLLCESFSARAASGFGTGR